MPTCRTSLRLPDPLPTAPTFLTASGRVGAVARPWLADDGDGGDGGGDAAAVSCVDVGGCGVDVGCGDELDDDAVGGADPNLVDGHVVGSFFRLGDGVGDHAAHGVLIGELGVGERHSPVGAVVGDEHSGEQVDPAEELHEAVGVGGSVHVDAVVVVGEVQVVHVHTQNVVRPTTHSKSFPSGEAHFS